MPTVRSRCLAESAWAVPVFGRCCRLQSAVIRSVWPAKRWRCHLAWRRTVTFPPFAQAFDHRMPPRADRPTPCSRLCQNLPPAWQPGQHRFQGRLAGCGMMSVGMTPAVVVTFPPSRRLQRRHEDFVAMGPRGPHLLEFRPPHKRVVQDPLAAVVRGNVQPRALRTRFSPSRTWNLLGRP